jgi:hypothetical protein
VGKANKDRLYGKRGMEKINLQLETSEESKAADKMHQFNNKNKSKSEKKTSAKTRLQRRSRIPHHLDCATQDKKKPY